MIQSSLRKIGERLVGLVLKCKRFKPQKAYKAMFMWFLKPFPVPAFFL